MASYNLRPVSDDSASPSPSVNSPGTRAHSPPFGPTGAAHSRRPPSPNAPRSRRPLSPSSLRDVNLPHGPEPSHRTYPAPPTGHELMAMFPPAPPANFPEMRPGPTSGFFARQERQFFAQAGKEIVRVHIEIDFPPDGPPGTEVGKSRPRDHPAAPSAVPRPYPSAPHSQHPSSAPPAPGPSGSSYPYPPPSSRQPRAPQPGPSTTPYSSHAPPHGHPQATHHASHDQRSPPMDSHSSPTEYQEEYREEDDSWRRPMPYAERRRAGKHTKRVIVRS